MLRQIRRLATSRDKWNCLISEVPPKPANSGTLANKTFVAKDNFTTKEHLTTCGSKSLSNYRSPFTATAVELLENRGSILVGKANMDEFGMGSSTTSSFYGATVNPRYEGMPRISGGSSGGSAAAVAAEMADFALGSDTGGSVRQPASYCGVYGFKPTYGRISRYGLIAYSQSLDTVGIFASDLETVTSVYGTLDHHDEKDITSMPEWLRLKFSDALPEKLTIGVPEEILVQELLSETISKFTSVLEQLQQDGHSIVPISIPSIKKSLSAYYTLATAEAASNLSRFDGIRFGFSVEDAENAEQLTSRNRSLSLGPEVQNRILLGNYTLSSESGDHFLRATKAREEIVREFSDIFAKKNHLLDTPENPSGCDIVLSPTTFGEPPTIGEYKQKTSENFLNGYINDILTVPASLSGCPAISLPIGDFGLHVMAQYGYDNHLLEACRRILNKNMH